MMLFSQSVKKLNLSFNKTLTCFIDETKPTPKAAQNSTEDRTFNTKLIMKSTKLFVNIAIFYTKKAGIFLLTKKNPKSPCRLEVFAV